MTKVLIIEDDPWLADSFAHTLVAHDLEVSVAHSAAQAIDVVDEAMPDVIVADVILGEANVLTLLHELQSYSDTQSIPVILCSTLDLDNHQSDGSLKPYGVREVLNKATLTPESLYAAVQGALNGVAH